jgi:hypothetical protein
MLALARTAMKTLACRAAFFVCGGFSVLTGVIFYLFRFLDTADHDRQAWWIVFSIAMLAVGIVSVAVAMLPKSRAKILFGVRLDHGAWLLSPVKLLAVFFVAAYIVAVAIAPFLSTMWLPPLWAPDERGLLTRLMAARARSLFEGLSLCS